MQRDSVGNITMAPKLKIYSEINHPILKLLIHPTIIFYNTNLGKRRTYSMRD